MFEVNNKNTKMTSRRSDVLLVVVLDVVILAVHRTLLLVYPNFSKRLTQVGILLNLSDTK